MLPPTTLTLQEGLTQLERFPNLDDIEDAANALCIVVRIYWLGSLNDIYLTEEPCLDILRREPALHEMMKLAHSAGVYDTVINSSFIRRPKIPRVAEELMRPMRPLVASFLALEDPLKAWDPATNNNDDVLAHIKSLNIRTLDSRDMPLVILKDLGSFSSDKLLGERIKNIFVKGKHTVLVNTSGSGKTRLLFEGLFREWGFYFTSVRDTSGLGPYDIHRIIESGLHSEPKFLDEPHPDSPNFSEQLASNNLLAHKSFSEALLARLLIFRMFLETAAETGITEEHKSKWLLLQLDSSLGRYSDIFDELTIALWDEDSYTQENIADVLHDIRELLGPELHLFFALDESQEAADGLPRAFDATPGKRPVLLAILDVWRQHLPDTLFSVIIAGTEVAPQIFEDTPYAERLRWTSDTGAFDEQPVQERYLRRFLPPLFLTTSSGIAFLERAWKWTHGRHRYTAALVGELLQTSFESPHSLLDRYVKNLCGFQPNDGEEYVRIESSKRRGGLGFTAMKFSALELSSDAETKLMMQEVLYNYLVTNAHPPVFRKANIRAVALDYGRFTDPDMSQIVINEPIVLAGAATWLNGPPSPPEQTGQRSAPSASHSYLTSLRRYPPSTPKMFAKCLAFYFVHAFASKPKLSDVFTFTDPTKPLLSWAGKSAELVELHPLDDDIPYSVISAPDPPSGPLATSAGRLEEVVSWLEHKDRTTFCVPASGNPDLLFALKLAGGSFVWVIVQATPSASDGVDLLNALDEEYLMRADHRDPGLVHHNRAVELLNFPPAPTASKRSSKRRLPTVLRVVASFDNQIALTSAEDDAPHASLSMEHFHQVTQAISPTEVVASMIASVLGKRKESDGGNGEGTSRETKLRKSVPVAADMMEREGKEGKGEGTSRETKRRKLLPVAADAMEREGKDGKGKETAQEEETWQPRRSARLLKSQGSQVEKAAKNSTVDKKSKSKKGKKKVAKST